MIYTDDNYISGLLKKRKTDAHKGDFGKILIFAGSLGMAGAAVLCGRAALRTGSGLVQFLLPELPCEIYPILQTAVPEATCVAYSEALDLNAYDAIACGSGIGQSETSKQILTAIFAKYGINSAGQKATPKVLVLDADALNLISKDPELAELTRSCTASVIITPHVGEAKRLLNSCAGIASLSDRKNATFDLADKYQCIAVLKGAGTLVAETEKDTAGSFTRQGSGSGDRSASAAAVYENTTGNPGMATAGSGDTLSGIIVSLAGQGYAPLDAARAGVFLHGKAGDLAAEKLGEMSVTAGDICDHIPEALKRYYETP